MIYFSSITRPQTSTENLDSCQEEFKKNKFSINKALVLINKLKVPRELQFYINNSIRNSIIVKHLRLHYKSIKMFYNKMQTHHREEIKI